jgi:hypothetical protein
MSSTRGHRLIKLLGKILFASHLLSCMWFVVNQCKIDDNYDDWVDCGGSSLASKYLASFYWTIATLMTVGYGDISANTNRFVKYSIFTYIIRLWGFKDT